MSFFSSFLLGLIQGIAEFLPISSSGHLAIAQNLLGMQDAGVVPDLRRAGHCPSLYPHPGAPGPAADFAHHRGYAPAVCGAAY